MKIQDTTASYSLPTNEAPAKRSNSTQTAVGFTQENNIKDISQQVIVNNYFEVFDKSLSVDMIKNLISARLQPEHKLPNVHNFEALSAKADKLLDFSIAI